MRITRISTAVVEANFDWTIVKVETDENITGYGEAFLGPGVTTIIREFSSILVGEDPTSIERILRRMRACTLYAAPGLVLHAIGGIEAALLDALGKRHRMPVWQMLGGKYRNSVPIYADCHAGEALESISPMLVPRTPACSCARFETRSGPTSDWRSTAIGTTGLKRRSNWHERSKDSSCSGWRTRFRRRTFRRSAKCSGTPGRHWRPARTTTSALTSS